MRYTLLPFFLITLGFAAPLRAGSDSLLLGAGSFLLTAGNSGTKEAFELNLRYTKSFDERLSLFYEYSYTRISRRWKSSGGAVNGGAEYNTYNEVTYQPHQLLIGGQMALDYGFEVWGGLDLGYWSAPYNVDIRPIAMHRYRESGTFLQASSGIGQHFSLTKNLQWGVDWFMCSTDLLLYRTTRRLDNNAPNQYGIGNNDNPREEVGTVRDMTKLKVLRVYLIWLL